MKRFILFIALLSIIAFGCSNDSNGVVEPQQQALVSTVDSPRFLHWQGVDTFLTKKEWISDGEWLYVERYLDRHTDAVVVVAYEHGQTQVRTYLESSLHMAGRYVKVKYEGRPGDILCVYIHGELTN